jgi:HD-GYP domain-containing protein (c-di-GMP phosphodiesterase class II)
MKTASPNQTIDVQALRVGMFVHLDGGWMSHPFPLSNFRITSSAQLATIRSLGLRRVRWSPQQSEVDGDADDGVAASALPVAATAPTVDAANDDRGTGPDAADTVPNAPLAESATVEPAVAGATRAQVESKKRLARQREAKLCCERQYAEAARACRQTFDLVVAKPEEARGQAEKLSRALLDKMIGAEELCIRVLGEAAGDKASLHALNVAIVSLLMGRCFGFDAEEMMDVGVGAMLHDVGKIELPVRLRHRDDSFSANELRVYREHVANGVAQARRMGLTAGASAVIAQHHEHADGSGFPGGLISDRMTMAARIVALVDRYDNLCNPHLPARALTPHESLSLLFAQGRSKYDTSILGAFIKMMGVYPPGSMVQLTDDRYAFVVATNSSRPLKPNVLVHDAAVPRAEALVLDLESVSGLGIRRSVRLQQLPPPVADYLAPSSRVSYFFEPAGAVEDEE